MSGTDRNPEQSPSAHETASGGFADWSGLGAPARDEASAACAPWATAVQEQFGCFVEWDRPGDTADDAEAPLAGLPYAAKDMFDRTGRAPRCGFGPVPERRPRADAAALHRLDRAGARRIGFTTMTAFAYEPSGAGTALNPWNRDFVPGGSSSGSAVAVASGAVFAALGSDTAGSLRIPAQGCGVTCWKPTHGAVPADGAMALSSTLDTIGVLARSARDIRLMAPILTAAITAAVTDDEAARTPTRVVVLGDAMDGAEAPVRAACAQGVEAIATCGTAVASRDALAAIERLSDPLFTVLQAEAAREHAALGLGAGDQSFARRLAKGRSIGAETLAAAQDALRAARAPFLEAVFAGADALLLPVMPIRTPRVAEADPFSPEFSAATLYRLSAYTRFVNALGLPAVAVPVGFDDRDMPVALQIVGRPGADGGLLALAAAMQAHTGWHRRRPTEITDVPSPLAERGS